MLGRKKFSLVLAVFVAVSLALFSVGSQAQYLSTTPSGIRHCMLMYSAINRSAASMEPYVVKMVDGVAQQNAYLFDSFIFLKIIAASGQQTDSGNTTKADWVDMLDTFFNSNNDIQSLSTAISNITSKIGPPPSTRKVFIGIPWPNPSVTNFGDVDGDGINENLSSQANRKKVIDWYIDEACSRWASHNYPNLTLAGFYWIRECNDVYTATTTDAMKKVHSKNLQLMWIPYFRAPGYTTAYNFFDIVIMQPNYAFNSWVDGGTDRPVKLRNTAKDCYDRTFGFEIENRSCPPNKYDGAIFKRYLAWGAGSHEGYQDDVNAYFLDYNFIETTYNTAYEEYYEALCDYVLGNTVADPDSRIWGLTRTSPYLIGGTGTANPISYVDVVIDTDQNTGWRGILTAELKTGNGNYTPVGWLVVTEDSAEDTSCYTIPVDGSTGDTIRITKTDWVGTFNLNSVYYLILDTSGPRSDVNYCLHKNYKLTTDVARKYPDNAAGNKLIDGVIDQTGYPWTNSIGWLQNKPIQIKIDLGGIKTVTGVEVYFLGGGSGVNFPSQTRVSFGSDKFPEYVTSGVGGFPNNFATVAGSSPMELSRRSSADITSKVVHNIGYSVSSRYIYLSVIPSGWTMISEIRVKNGANSVTVNSYKLRSQPSPNDGIPYYDDGKMLTDAVVASNSKGVAGWCDGGYSRALDVDLESVKSISDFKLYTLGGGEGGIFAPDSVEFFTSVDGTTWTSQGTVFKPNITENGTGTFPVEYRLILASNINKRFVRAVVNPGNGWCMLSEFKVG